VLKRNREQVEDIEAEEEVEVEQPRRQRLKRKA